MEKPIIGIIIRSYLEDDKSVLKLNEEYRSAIVKTGGIPFLLAPINDTDYGRDSLSNKQRLSTESKRDLLQILSFCDGFLVTGGEYWYDTDEIICQYAYQHNLPYLGICLGMQVLGNMDSFIEPLVSDKTVKNATEINHYQPAVSSVHKVFIYPSKLRSIFQKKELWVNSRHQYHILPKEWFLISAYSEDGLIEGIEIPNKRFMIGVQWHPESLLSCQPEMFCLFEKFVAACRNEE